MAPNTYGWRQRLARLRGSSVEFDLRSYDTDLEAINRCGDGLQPIPDVALSERAATLRARARAGESLSGLRTETFALAREAASRTIGLRPFDVQVLAGLAMDRGAVVEMQTGEGKTLAAVLPAALNALTARGVHILTFNDYLATRDAEWMGPAYRALGLSVGFVQEGMPPDQRRQAYAADVTYVTAKEAGFDRLRDQLATDLAGIVHRPLHMAIVDEADSLLVDEARVPLVVAGAVDGGHRSAARLAALVRSLAPGVEYDTDEYGRDVELTEAGIERVEHALDCGPLHDPVNLALLTEINCALHAHALLARDVDYIVRDGRVEIVDEFTGRVVSDRHWPDGLQAALEAKEGLERRADGRILASMTLQHVLGGYPRLAGMTGTARDAAEELEAFYGLRVVVIPTNRPMVRVDQPDVVFARPDAKMTAVVEEIRRVHEAGRPVLVGTASVAESEALAARLRTAGVDCVVLNAKNDRDEARVVARAGAVGAVTISTNMAGRGTDIRLGGADEADRGGVVALGGLYVIGTNRHESRRVDLQLRGRAGRQGDPGESRFFVSLEDGLLVRYGLKDLLPAGIASPESAKPVENPIVNREIARAQRIIEGQDFEIRRTLWRYAVIVERQRQLAMARRQAILAGGHPPDLWRRAPGRRAALVAAVGEAGTEAAERAVTLHAIDRAWRDHLAHCADLREGVHLVSLGGRDPLTHFTTEAIRAFDRFDDTVDATVLEALDRAVVRDGAIDLEAIGVRGPSSTWTYLVNDDPFRNRIGALLAGPGGATVAIYAAVVLAPLLVLWGLVDRFLGHRPARRPPP